MISFSKLLKVLSLQFFSETVFLVLWFTDKLNQMKLKYNVILVLVDDTFSRT